MQSEDNDLHLLELLRFSTIPGTETARCIIRSSYLVVTVILIWRVPTYFPNTCDANLRCLSLFLPLQTEHDECGSGQHNCDENAICTNTVRGHSCTCKPGYVGNGTICRGRLAVPAWAPGTHVADPCHHCGS